MKDNKIVRSSRLFAAAVLAILALASIAAGAAPGASWDNAVDLSSTAGQPQTLAAGASEWYVIHHVGGTQDEIDLSTNGVGGVNFAVYTPDEIAAWVGGDPLSAIGQGTYNPDESNYDLTWVGHPASVDGAPYYLQVTNTNTSATQFAINLGETALP